MTNEFSICDHGGRSGNQQGHRREIEVRGQKWIDLDRDGSWVEDRWAASMTHDPRQRPVQFIHLFQLP